MELGNEISTKIGWYFGHCRVGKQNFCLKDFAFACEGVKKLLRIFRQICS